MSSIWNVRTAKVSASTIQEKSNDANVQKAYVDSTEKWNQQVDEFENLMSTQVESKRKDRIIKFFRSFFKSATTKDADDILVSC